MISCNFLLNEDIENVNEQNPPTINIKYLWNLTMTNCAMDDTEKE